MFVCPECGDAHQHAGYCPADGTALAPRGDDGLLGAHIGPYRVARLLGVGGMGRVYKAVHPAIGSRVAIKVLSGDCVQNGELVTRFFAEARAVNLIRHESIVNVLDLSSLPDGRPYIVMEYLDGASLSRVIEVQGALPLGGLARLLAEVADALGAAHLKGIVHRDLKPDNIFVSPQGRAKVLDFGIAKLMPELGGQVGHTRTGSLLGTPHYMAPEQAMARPVDARTDVYALGVILFEGATGRRPFIAQSLFELLHMQVTEPPPRPIELRPDLPAAYEAVILRALAKEPEQRFASAAELVAELMHAARELPPQAWAAVVPPSSGAARAAMSASTPMSAPTPMSGGTPMAGVMTHGHASSVDVRTGAVGQRRVGRWIGGAIAVVAVGAVAVVALRGGDEAGSAGIEAMAPGQASERVDTATTRANQPQPAGQPVQITPYGLPGTYQPANFDPRRFDVTGFLDEAEARARGHYDDAALVRIDAQGVRPDGLADLTLGENYLVIYHFNSPSRGKRPVDLPLGVEHKPDCKVYVWVSAAGVRPFTVDGTACNEPVLGAPRCSVREVWKRAIARRAPADNAVASLGYHEWDGKSRWYFMIGDVFRDTIEDDCP